MRQSSSLPPQHQTPKDAVETRADLATPTTGSELVADGLPLPINLLCPGCAKEFEVSAAKAGDRVSCPSCQARFFVPPQALLPTSEPAPSAEPTSVRPDAASGPIAAGSPTPRTSGGAPSFPHAAPPEQAPSSGGRAGVWAAVIGGTALLLALTVGLIWWALATGDPAHEKELASKTTAERSVTVPQRAGVEKREHPPVQKEAEPPLSPRAKLPDREEPAPAVKSVGQPRSELILPLDAVAPVSKLKEIKTVKIKGKVRFTKASNVNDVVVTWESIRTLKYEEYGPSITDNLLFLDRRGWRVSRGEVQPLEGETLAFYQVFTDRRAKVVKVSHC